MLFCRIWCYLFLICKYILLLHLFLGRTGYRPSHQRLHIGSHKMPQPQHHMGNNSSARLHASGHSYIQSHQPNANYPVVAYLPNITLYVSCNGKFLILKGIRNKITWDGLSLLRFWQVWSGGWTETWSSSELHFVMFHQLQYCPPHSTAPHHRSL